MLGLVSTTECNVLVPKEAIYRHIKTDTHTRREFIDTVESIRVVNSVKEETAAVKSGKNVTEIIVFDIHLKTPNLPMNVLETLAQSIPKADIFVCSFGEQRSIAVYRNGVRYTRSTPIVNLSRGDLDQIWDDFCAKVIWGRPLAPGEDVNKHLYQISMKQHLRTQISRLETKLERCVQKNRRNELYKQKSELQRRLNDLEDEDNDYSTD